MRMPDRLQIAIEEAVAGSEHSALRRASAEISVAYKNGDFTAPILRSSVHRSAYTLVRMPATYAANVHALRNLQSSVPGFAPRTVLDLGSGPGTSAWAAAEVFPSIETFTLLERDPGLVELGRSLAGRSESTSLRRAEWRSCDLVNSTTLPKADLILISYALGELENKNRLKVVERAWMAAQQALVVIEPGTKKGFEIVLGVRTQLLGMDAQLAAPCPHMNQCPMAAAGDWCHFAQRIERSSEHRRLKDGALGYEDEKFSYVAGSRMPVSSPRARVVRHPGIFSGYVKLELCSGPSLERQTVTRSQGKSYKEARHARWGDGWEY
jgi:ribosomal protein RSM22 (predicted rRNA methylase)